jgi:uncharacterized protein YybS (DUF2232 family)
MSRLLSDPKLAPVAAAAFSVGLFAAPWLVPIVGTFATIWAPAPLLAIYRRQGSRSGRLALMIGLIGAVLIVGNLVSSVAAMIYLAYAAAALILGEAYVWGQSDESGIAVAAGVSWGAVIAVTWGSGLMDGGGQAWLAYWTHQTSAVVQAYKESGLSPESLEDVRYTLQLAGQLIAHLALGILACVALIVAWANQLLARRLSPAGERAALDTWRAPDRLVWVLIAAGAMMALLDGFWFWTGANLVLVLSLIYFFQGIAVLAFWLKKKNAPRLLRVGIYLLVAVEIFLALLVALMGLFDLWFNFRRLGKEPVA